MRFSAKEPPNHNRGDKIDCDNCEISRIGREGGQQARLYPTGRQSRLDVWRFPWTSDKVVFRQGIVQRNNDDCRNRFTS